MPEPKKPNDPKSPKYPKSGGAEHKPPPPHLSSQESRFNSKRVQDKHIETQRIKIAPSRRGGGRS